MKLHFLTSLLLSRDVVFPGTVGVAGGGGGVEEKKLKKVTSGLIESID